MPIVSSLAGEYGFGLHPLPRLATAVRITPQVNKKNSHDFDLDGDIVLCANTSYMNPDTVYSITPNVNVTLGIAIWGGGGGSNRPATPGIASVGGTGGALFGTIELLANRKYDFLIGAPGKGVDDAGIVQESGGGGAASVIRDSTRPAIPLVVAGGGGGNAPYDNGHKGGHHSALIVNLHGNVGVPITKGGDGGPNSSGGVPGTSSMGFGGGRGGSNWSGGGGGGYPTGGYSGNYSVTLPGGYVRSGYGGQNYSNVATIYSTVYQIDSYTLTSFFPNERYQFQNLPELFDIPKAQTLLLPTRVTANIVGSPNTDADDEWRECAVNMIPAGGVTSLATADGKTAQYGMIRLWLYEHNAVKFTGNLDTPSNNKVITNGSLKNEVGYRQIKFTDNGAFTIENPGINDTIEIVCVGAGGNGFNYLSNRRGGQGGDAGKIVYQVVPAYAGVYTVKIGSAGETRTEENKSSYVINPYSAKLAWAPGGDDGVGTIDRGLFEPLQNCKGLFINFYDEFTKDGLGTPGAKGVHFTHTGGFIDWNGTVTTFPPPGPGGGGSSVDAEPNSGSGGGGGLAYGDWPYDKPGGFDRGLGGSGVVYIRYCTRTGGGPSLEKETTGSTFFRSPGRLSATFYLNLSEPKYYAISNTPWTIEFWIYLFDENLNYLLLEEKENQNPQIWQKWLRMSSSTGGGSGLRWKMSSYHEIWGQNASVHQAVVSSVDMPLREWTHVAFVYDGSTTGTHTKIYINGINSTIPHDATGMVHPYPSGWLAQSQNPYPGNTLFQINPNGECYISNFRYTLSAVYTENFTPSKSRLPVLEQTILLTGVDPYERREGYYQQSNVSVAYTSTNTIPYRTYWNERNFYGKEDGTGESNLTKYFLAPTNVAASVFSPSYEPPAIINYSAFFAPRHNYTTVTGPANSNKFNFTSDLYTIEFWIYPCKPVGSKYCRVIMFGINDTDGSFIGFQIAPNGTVQAGVPRTGYTGLSTPPNTIELNKWQHYAVVLDSQTTGRIYKDGILAASGPLQRPMLVGNNNIRIGGDNVHPVNFNYYGYISNLRIIKGSALYTEPSFTVPTERLTVTDDTVLLTFNSDQFVDQSASPSILTSGHFVRMSQRSPFNSNT